MPQFGIEEALGFTMQRVDQLSGTLNTIQIQNNVMFRILYEKGIMTEEDLKQSFIKEYKLLESLGILGEMLPDDVINQMVDERIKFIKCDKEGILAMQKDMEEKIKEQLRKEQSRIEVADSGVLTALDSMGGTKKLII